MTTHQSHIGDQKGQTDSSYKLTRLKFPDDLTSKSVLDIGCNEGFFCNEAIKRNARRVVGIDANRKFLDEAIRRYKTDNSEFQLRSWHDLPDEKFDMIVWSSAMHYELDPVTVLTSIADRLSPDGLFILECGVHFATTKEMIYVVRHDGGLWYPTQRFIEEGLRKAGLTFRMVSQAELVGTDPVPRVVYHCSRSLPTVLLVVGSTKRGKSTLAGLIGSAATKVISLDHLVARIGAAKWAFTPLEEFIKKNIDSSDLGKVYRGIDEAGLTEAYAKLLSRAVAASDSLVVFEGFLTDAQLAGLKKLLEPRARVWVAN